MHPGKKTSFRRQGAKITHLSTIGPQSLLEDADTERFFLDMFEGLLDRKIRYFRIRFLESCFHFIAQSTDRLGALHLAGLVDGILDAIPRHAVADLKMLVLGHRYGVVTLFLATLGHQFLLSFHQLGNVSLGESQGIHEVRFRDLVSGAFDHDHVGLIPNVYQIEITLGPLLKCRVDDEFAFHPANAHGPDRPCKGNI